MPDTAVMRGAVTDSPSFWHMIVSLLFSGSAGVAGQSGLPDPPFTRHLIKAGFLENYQGIFSHDPGLLPGPDRALVTGRAVDGPVLARYAGYAATTTKHRKERERRSFRLLQKKFQLTQRLWVFRPKRILSCLQQNDFAGKYAVFMPGDKGRIAKKAAGSGQEENHVPDKNYQPVCPRACAPLAALRAGSS
jgi:hypothetical protein